MCPGGGPAVVLTQAALGRSAPPSPFSLMHFSIVCIQNVSPRIAFPPLRVSRWGLVHLLVSVLFLHAFI